MSSTIISILLLISFAVFIFYILKGGNLVIGFFVMAILWSVIGMVPFSTAIQKVFAEPALNYGPTIIILCLVHGLGEFWLIAVLRQLYLKLLIR